MAKSRSKLHWSEGKRPGDVLWVTLCGQLVVETATAPSEVTCKKCRRKLLDMKPQTGPEEYVTAVFAGNAFQFHEPTPLIDPTSELPVINRFTWPTIKARRHWCGHCAVCLWLMRLESEEASRPWVKRHFISTGYRWASVTHALEWYARVRWDGFSMGTLGEVLDKLGRLGTRIATHGSKGQQKAIEQAQDAIVVERAISKCYMGPSRRLLSRRERLYCLFETLLNGTKPHVIARRIMEANPSIEGLTGPMVTGIVRDGRWTVYEELRVRDMIPPR